MLQKRLRRIEIEEIGADEEVVKIQQQISSALSKQSHTKQRITEQDSQQFDRLLANQNAVHTNQNKDDGDGLADGRATSFSSPADIIAQSASSSDKDSKASERESTRDSAASQSRVTPDSGDGDAATVDAARGSPRDYSHTNGLDCDTDCSAAASTAARDVTIPAAPSTSYQFLADYKRLKGSPQHFYQYFKVTHSSAQLLASNTISERRQGSSTSLFVYYWWSFGLC